MKTMQIIILFLIILELGFLCYLGEKMNRGNNVTSEKPPLEAFTNTLHQLNENALEIIGWQTTPYGCLVIYKGFGWGKEYYEEEQFVKVQSEYGTDWYMKDGFRYYKVQN